MSRAACESCGETYTDDNLFDCPHCGGDHCYRCKDRHIAACGAQREERPGDTC